MIDKVLFFNSIKTVATLSVLNKAIAKTQAIVFSRPEREVYNEILTAISQTETAIADSIYLGVNNDLTLLIKS